MSHWTEENRRQWEKEYQRVRMERGPHPEASRLLVWVIKQILKICPMRRELSHVCGLLWWCMWMDKYWPKSPGHLSCFSRFRRRLAIKYAIWCWNSPWFKKADRQVEIAKIRAEFESPRKEPTA